MLRDLPRALGPRGYFSLLQLRDSVSSRSWAIYTAGRSMLCGDAAQRRYGQKSTRPSRPVVRCRTAIPTTVPRSSQQLLAAELDRFVEVFVKQLATFAVRRVMTIDDEAQLQAITAASKPSGYQLHNVLENLVTSELFHRR